MGIVELFPEERLLLISSDIYLYGTKATTTLLEIMEAETETMWNEPKATVRIDNTSYLVQFKIQYFLQTEITPLEIVSNVNPRNNYIRIEDWHWQYISFVDGLGSNTGYYLAENLYQGSTTAAHEYGHTIGLPHPENMDLRGKGVPGIMYARGTLVNPEYQYDPKATPGPGNGGTMHPKFRKVLSKDIYKLGLEQLTYKNNLAIIGDFTNQWHDLVEKPN